MSRAFAATILMLAAVAAPPAVGIVPPIPVVAPGLLPGGETKTDEAPADPLPPVDPNEDPLKTVERITQTAKAVGDRLKEQDAGTGTRKQQDQLLRDIDALLKKQNDPPPMGGGGGGGGGAQQPMGGGGGGGRRQRGGGAGQQSKQDGGGGGAKGQQPMGGGADQKTGQGGGGAGEQKTPTGGGGANQPQAGGGAKDPKNAGGGMSGRSTQPTLPLDDPFSNQVWGHLPEKLRQQAMQSFREKFMPKYDDLLKQYYSNIAEREKTQPKK